MNLNDIISYLREFNFITICLRLILAVVVGGIIGNERGRHGSPAGLRTHILVCIGSAITSLTGYYVYHTLGIGSDVLRLSAQVVSGIGFLGAGMIIVKNSNMITGLTTAAGMWATAAIGIALGYGFYSGAIIGMLTCFFTAAVLTRLERKRKMAIHIYAEVDDILHIGDIADKVRSCVSGDILVETIAAKSNLPESIGLYITVSGKYATSELRKTIEKIDGIRFAISE
ncbi:MAG: MgtC/SapB family protein [Ruminococcaceae bacterium]|nr:MgtC/SapB family protein [Oscillospiraceae bacterium]